MSKPIQRVLLAGNRLKQIDALRKAAQEDGCFYVGETPLNEIKQAKSKCLQQLDKYYKQPLEVKKQIGSNEQRGYFQIGDESGSVELLEKKECFTYGYDSSKFPETFWKDSYFAQNNIFPKDLDQKDFQEMIQGFNDTAFKLVDLCSEAFETDFNSTIDETSTYQSFIKSFRYYGKDVTDSQNTTGNSLHSDWNLLTLVWADVKGFELLRDDGKYDQIHPENSEDLICNFGDFIACLTGGTVRSPWHRVVLPPKGQTRDSLVYFFYPKHTHEAVKTPIIHQGRPLGLFVDQSKPGNQLWEIPEDIKVMGDMYKGKWQQVGRSY